MKPFACLLVALLATLLNQNALSATLTVTSTADSGAGSLRQAMLDAGTNPGLDIIEFAAGVAGTIALNSVLPEISGDLQINGPGANVLAIQGNGTFGVFTIASAAVTISGLSVTGGNAQFGGGVANSGGTVTIDGCYVYSNTAQQSGGGIYSTGTGASLSLRNSTVAYNNALVGAGIHSFNVALSVINCTISLNTATAHSGGIYAEGISASAPAVIRSSTVVHNTATSVAGGGIGTTVAATIGSTILAYNTAPQNPDAFGSFASTGYNIMTDTTGTSGFIPSDIIDAEVSATQPVVAAALADNGGPTLTHAPLNQAVEAIGNSTGPTTDQRGVFRPQGDYFDIGAVELQAGTLLLFADERVKVHYHNQAVTGATTDNKGYTRAEIRGDIIVSDPDAILNYLLGPTASTLPAKVAAILGGTSIAMEVVTLEVKGGNREKWEFKDGTGAVRSLKIHWKNAIHFSSVHANPKSPKIESKFIGLTTTDLRFEAKPGTYDTLFPTGVVVRVANGLVIGVDGLGAAPYEIHDNGKKVDFTLPYRLAPGMQISTAALDNELITVTEDVNYFGAVAKFDLKLEAVADMPVPLFNDPPNTLAYQIVLGSTTKATANSVIGYSPKLWDKNENNHKQYRDDTAD